jgi:alpha-tubulin suppressor-like RCC1 family protein
MNSSVPVPASGITGVTAIAAGRDHTCAVLVSGSLQCWGNNEQGRLGNGTTQNSSTPVTVVGF